jgi:hypothetical protein
MICSRLDNQSLEYQPLSFLSPEINFDGLVFRGGAFEKHNENPHIGSFRFQAARRPSGQAAGLRLAGGTA